MAWNATKTWHIGDIVTEADMNAYWRDNLDYLKARVLEPGTNISATPANGAVLRYDSASGKWMDDGTFLILPSLLHATSATNMIAVLESEGSADGYVSLQLRTNDVTERAIISRLQANHPNYSNSLYISNVSGSATVGAIIIYDDGSIRTTTNFGVKAKPDGSFHIEGSNARWLVSTDGRYLELRTTADTATWNHYPYIVFKDYGGIRGAYIGYGFPGSYIEWKLENGNNLAIHGGNVGFETAFPQAVVDINGDLILREMTTPAAPPVDAVRVFARDDDTVTELVAQFPDGSLATIAKRHTATAKLGTEFSTTSTTWVDVLSVAITTHSGNVVVCATVPRIRNDNGGYATKLRLVVGSESYIFFDSIAYNVNPTGTGIYVFNPGVGTHTVKLQMAVAGGTGRINYGNYGTVVSLCAMEM